MIPLPQRGGCICGGTRFTLREDPVTVYACHCTDCQTETGSACLIAVVVRNDAVEWEGLEPEDCGVVLADSRRKGGHRCPRCKNAAGGESRGDGLSMIDGGAFDDTSWLVPAGHIWTDSAQPWLTIPENALSYPRNPEDADWIDMARAWKERTHR